ncbi:secreted RxLR effector protein 161-like [Nicotiana tabacum]
MVEELLIILVYVDDLLVTGRNLPLIKQVKKDLEESFKITDLGELNRGKPAATTLEFNHKLTSIEFDQLIHGGKSVTDDVELDDKGKFQRLVGRLLYLTTTRPDIAFVVQVLSQYIHAPKVSHMEFALRVIRYTKIAPGLALFMPAEKCHQLVAYCDLDQGSCVETRKSVTGYMVKFGEALISWKSKKQGTLSRSSTEAEFRSMAATVAEVIWITRLFKELRVEVSLPTL